MSSAAKKLAVRQGFEPSGTAFRPYNGLANRRLQPLGHLTALRRATTFETRNCPAGDWFRTVGLSERAVERPIIAGKPPNRLETAFAARFTRRPAARGLALAQWTVPVADDDSAAPRLNRILTKSSVKRSTPATRSCPTLP